MLYISPAGDKIPKTGLRQASSKCEDCEIESPGSCNSLCHCWWENQNPGNVVSGRDEDNLFTQRGRVSWVHRAHNAGVIIWFRIYYLSFALNTRTPSHYAFCSNIGITLTSSHLRPSVGDNLIANFRARVENFGLKLSTKLFVACQGATAIENKYKDWLIFLSWSLIEICADKIAILVNPLIYVQLTCATNNQFMPSYFDLSIRQVLSTNSFCDLIEECNG